MHGIDKIDVLNGKAVIIAGKISRMKREPVLAAIACMQ